jgi:hypothetical protein
MRALTSQCTGAAAAAFGACCRPVIVGVMRGRGVEPTVGRSLFNGTSMG